MDLPRAPATSAIVPLGAGGMVQPGIRPNETDALVELEAVAGGHRNCLPYLSCIFASVPEKMRLSFG